MLTLLSLFFSIFAFSTHYIEVTQIELTRTSDEKDVYEVQFKACPWTPVEPIVLYLDWPSAAFPQVSVGMVALIPEIDCETTLRSKLIEVSPFSQLHIIGFPNSNP